MGIEIVNMYIKIGVLGDPKEEKKKKKEILRKYLNWVKKKKS